MALLSDWLEDRLTKAFGYKPQEEGRYLTATEEAMHQKELELCVLQDMQKYNAMSAQQQHAAVLQRLSQMQLSPGTTFATTAAVNQALVGTVTTLASTGLPPRPWHEAWTGIRTPRLFLMEFEGTQEFLDRCLSPEALEEIVSWLNNKELMKYSRQSALTHTVEGQRNYLMNHYGGRALMASYHPPKYWFIFRADDERTGRDKLIGTITRDYIKDGSRHRGADIGILLGAEQGRGYALEAMNGIINWHIGHGFSRFQIGTDERNEPMIKLATSCGMIEYKRENGHVYMGMTLPPSATATLVQT